ncbi:MAG: hypothetical protein WHS44_05580 [Fimbriimonadales bacterium]|nr:MAG: hypothetical protein KatS3mg018_2461 [Fimbriimonadales bacterium]
MNRDSDNRAACLNCSHSCSVKSEIEGFYSKAKAALDSRSHLRNFVGELFECLGQMVQNGDIQDAESLGIALGASFDLCISLLYTERVANLDWLYCQNAPPMSFYPYLKGCPRCGSLDSQATIKAHKPSSDTIGRYTTACLAAILCEMCRVSRNGFEVRVLDASRGDVDLLIFDAQTLILCEVKASPLHLLPVCVRHSKPLEREDGNEKVPVESHQGVSIADLENIPLYLYLVEERSFPLRWVSDGEKPYLMLESGRGTEGTCEILRAVSNAWAKMYAGYTSRWKEHTQLRWFTCGCGGSVDDSKNAPGLDRTDDIKKGVYQMLKIAEKYRRGCKEKRVRVALLSNMHPVVHYEEYLKGFEDALWTHEDSIQQRMGKMVSVDSDDLFPFYDMLFTLTRSWFREERLEQAFSLQTLYHALGGSR